MKSRGFCGSFDLLRKSYDIDLLAELLESRVEKGNTDYIDYSIEAAVEVVSKLTSEMLLLLPALHFIQTLVHNNPLELDEVYRVINSNFLSKCHNITPSKMKTIASLGAGSYINIIGSDTFKQMSGKYPFLKEPGAEAKFPNMVKALKCYDSKELHQLTLTTPGEVIAVKMLAKIFPAISLKDCLNK